MYPDAELTRLAAHKAALRRRIAARRADCAEALQRVAQPLAVLDRIRDLWRRVAPLARMLALPVGLLFARSVPSRTGFFGRVLRWTPIVFAAWRSFTAATRRPR